MRCYGTLLLRTQDRDNALRLIVDVLDNVKTKVLTCRSKGVGFENWVSAYPSQMTCLDHKNGLFFPK